jgi:hypothetical protein
VWKRENNGKNEPNQGILSSFRNFTTNFPIQLLYVNKNVKREKKYL